MFAIDWWDGKPSPRAPMHKHNNTNIYSISYLLFSFVFGDIICLFHIIMLLVAFKIHKNFGNIAARLYMDLKHS